MSRFPARVLRSAVPARSIEGRSSGQIGITAAEHGITLFELTAQSASLKDAYMALTPPPARRLRPDLRRVVHDSGGRRTNHEIAERLTLSETTVKTHVARVLGKLDLRDRGQVVIYAYEHGLVRPDG